MTQYEPDRIHQVSLAKTSLGVDTNIAATLCYVPLLPINFISSAVWLISEPKDNQFLRFHSAQSVVLGASFLALSVVLSAGTMIPFIGAIFGLAQLLVVGAYFISSFFLMYCGYQKRFVRLPVIANFADRLLEKIGG